MKYYSWKLKWEVNPATGSEEGWDINSLVATAHSVFTDDDLATNRDAKVYGYLETGTVDVDDWADYSLQEVTSAQFLAAAKAVNPEVVLNEDGLLEWPEVDRQPNIG
jgi:hypothetical protein